MGIFTQVCLPSFSFVFIMMQVCWPINDQSVSKHYPVVGILIWVVVSYFIWR